MIGIMLYGYGVVSNIRRKFTQLIKLLEFPVPYPFRVITFLTEYTPLSEYEYRASYMGSLDDPNDTQADKIKNHVVESVQGLEKDNLIFINERESPINYVYSNIPK
jgi:hypothetical protein